MSLWGKETKYIILQTLCPILPDILTNWHLFTGILLIGSCKEGAAIFSQTWDQCFGVCAPLVSAPYFHGIWATVHLSSIPDNLILHCSRQPSPAAKHAQPSSYSSGSPPPPSSDRFVLTATFCSPRLFAASVHLHRKKCMLLGAWIVLLKYVQHPV